MLYYIIYSDFIVILGVIMGFVKNLLKKMLLVVALSIFAFLLVSCSNSGSNDDSSSKAPLTPASISVPTNMIVYEVASHSNGVKLQEYVVEKPVYDNYKAWQEKTKIKEEIDEYETKKKIWDAQKKEQEDGEFWSEEERIEEYCKENGYLKCITMTETCLDDGCHKVTITCEDAFFEPGKLDYDDFDPDDECEEYEIVVEDSSEKYDFEGE